MASRIIDTLKSGVHELTVRPKGNIPVLDALRTLAIIMVVCGHFAEAFIQAGGQSVLARIPVFHFGWTGVDLFFVLSGFLIGRQLWKEIDRTGTISVTAFIVRRGVRIWPLYYFILAFFALALGKTGGDLSLALPDLLMVSNYFPGIVSGGWSLSTEEQFYIVVPMLLLAANFFLPVRRQWLLPVGLLFAIPVIRYIVMTDATGAIVKTSSDVYTAIHTHCDGLVAGLALAWLSVARPEALSRTSFSRNLPVPLALMILGAALRVANSHVFAFSALALIFAAMTLFLMRDQTLISKSLGLRPFYLVSKLSYGMYLNHFEVLPRLVPALESALSGPVGNASVRFLVELALATLTSIVSATVTFLLVEHPFLRMRDQILARITRRNSSRITEAVLSAQR